MVLVIGFIMEAVLTAFMLCMSMSAAVGLYSRALSIPRELFR